MQDTFSSLRTIAYQCLLELATEEGINASGKDEIYGCIFGRDTAITILKILHALEKDNAFSEQERTTLLSICKNALSTLTLLQGKETNVESGEEPGKFIHEYRKDKYDHLVNRVKPWFIYPDGFLRNYDSIDATPLGLIAIYKYWKMTDDGAFLLSVLPSVEQGLNWIITYGDKDKDFLLEYELLRTRTYGGLRVQSWTDSHESLLRHDGTMPDYPIAPVEVQGYAWLALNLWADFYRETPQHLHKTNTFAKKLSKHAISLKKRFNEWFLFPDGKHMFAAQALDGTKRQIQTVTGNPLLLLWAGYKKDKTIETVLDEKYHADVVNRAFQKDMFHPHAGIRTMSTMSPTFNPRENSYHNGSFWPKLNGMIHEGLYNFGFFEEAEKLKTASLLPIAHFKTPIELYVTTEEGMYMEFRANGQTSCRNQAWSAAVTLDLLT